MDNRRFAKFLLWLVVPLLLFVCVGSVAFVIGLNVYYGPVDEKLEARLEEIRAQGYPTNREELQEYLGKPTEEEQRATELLMEANSKIVRDDLFFYLEYTDEEDWELEKIDAIVDKNEEVLALIEEVLEIGAYRFPVKAGTFFEMLDQGQHGADMAGLRRVVRATWWLAMKRHKADKAVDAFIMSRYLSHSGEKQQPWMYSMLTMATTLSTLVDTVSLYREFALPKSELTRLKRSIELPASKRYLMRYFATHRCMDLIFYQDRRDEEPFDGFNEFLDSCSPFGDPVLKQIMANELRILDLYRPYFQVLESLPLERGALSEITLPENDHFDSLVGGVVLSRFFLVSMIEQLAVQRLLQCATAVEMYNAEQGRIPQTLDELSTKFIEAIPDDPFDGNPIRYRRLETGYLLYSVGSDQQDDNGKVDGVLKPDITFIVEKKARASE